MLGTMAGSKTWPSLTSRIMMLEPLDRLALACSSMPSGSRQQGQSSGHATLRGSNGKATRCAPHRCPGGGGCRGQLSTCSGVSCFFRCCDLSSRDF